jgi:hypothetical protein
MVDLVLAVRPCFSFISAISQLFCLFYVDNIKKKTWSFRNSLEKELK